MGLKKNIALSDSGFLFNPSTGDSFTLNPIGQVIVNMMKEDKERGEIVNHLVTYYQVDDIVAGNDYDDFTQMLGMHKLIE